MERSLGDGGMPLLAQLGVDFQRYGEGWVEAAWTPTDLACNPAGGVHGGVFGVIHDAAMNFATNSALAKGEFGATVSISYSTLRAAVAGALHAVDDRRIDVAAEARQRDFRLLLQRGADAALEPHRPSDLYPAAGTRRLHWQSRRVRPDAGS